MIDLHSHVLPAVDDGAENLAMSLALLRASADGGITQIAATPHVRADYPTTPEAMERGVAELNAAAREAGIPIVVLPGGELDIEEIARLDDNTLARFGLAGNPSVLLVECPYVGWPPGLRILTASLAAKGFTVVLAHPERNPVVQANPVVLRPLVDDGVLVQLTASSVDGRLGSPSKRASRALLDGGLAHLVASDAHSTVVRPAGLAAALASLDDPELARWLTEDVPGAVVHGAELPRRPVRVRHSRLRLRRPW
jgi:protein-tyrosine phosphatase